MAAFSNEVSENTMKVSEGAIRTLMLGENQRRRLSISAHYHVINNLYYGHNTGDSMSLLKSDTDQN